MGRIYLSSFHDIDAWTWLSPVIPWCRIFIAFGLHTRWLFVANSFSLSESSIWSKFTIPPSKTKLCLSFESLQVLSQFHINNATVPGSCPCNFSFKAYEMYHTNLSQFYLKSWNTLLKFCFCCLGKSFKLHFVSIKPFRWYHRNFLHKQILPSANQWQNKTTSTLFKKDIQSKKYWCGFGISYIQLKCEVCRWI